MNNIEHWLKNPEQLGAEAVSQLTVLIDRHPYCATYRMLYLVALANVHSTRLSGQLRRHAPALPDRERLFYLISRGEYEWVALMQQLSEQRHHHADANDFELIDRYLDDMEFGNAHTDAHYDLALLPDLPGQHDEQDDIIDSFLKAEAEGTLFVPNAAQSEPEDEVEEKLENIKDRAFLTESLAKVYVKQGKFEQALHIFSQLNLKFSKKNSYFADQIRYLEKVIELKKQKQIRDNSSD